MKHFGKRSVAILLVNQVAFLTFELSQGIWLMNAVLWALAIDYFLIGMLAALLEFVVEPSIERFYRKLRPHLTTSQPPSSIPFHIINFLLLGLSLVTLWWNIWLDQDHGNCSLHSQFVGTSVALPNLPSSAHCSLGGRLIYEFLFHTG